MPPVDFSNEFDDTFFIAEPDACMSWGDLDAPATEWADAEVPNRTGGPGSPPQAGSPFFGSSAGTGVTWVDADALFAPDFSDEFSDEYYSGTASAGPPVTVWTDSETPLAVCV